MFEALYYLVFHNKDVCLVENDEIGDEDVIHFQQKP